MRRDPSGQLTPAQQAALATENSWQWAYFAPECAPANVSSGGGVLNGSSPVVLVSAQLPSVTTGSAASQAAGACKGTFVVWNNGTQAPWTIKDTTNPRNPLNVWGGVGFSNVYTEIVTKFLRRGVRMPPARRIEATSQSCGVLC